MRALAEMMLEWETLQRRADELREAIEDTVLQVEASQVVGNVKAVYRGTSRRYDYKAVAKDAPPELVEEHTTVKRYVSWSAVVDAMNIDKADIPFKESPPSVKVKLVN
jgi:hypothetical protein